MNIKVLIDARKLGDGGIGVYIENLVDGLLELPEAVRPQLTLLVGPESEVNSSYRESWQDRVAFVEESSGKYSIGEAVLLPLRHRALIGEHDLYHAPHFTLPFGLGIPSIVTVHDVIHVTHPENFYHRPIGRLMIGSAISRAAHVITVSEASAREVREAVFEPPHAISVIHNALRKGVGVVGEDEVNRWRAVRGYSKPYALFVGSDRPHKGFMTMLRAWRQLERERDDDAVPHRILAVGRRYGKSIQKQIERLGLTAEVTFVDCPSTEELNLLYNGASFVVVPSRAEGFGFVALESMAAGVPVVVTPVPSLQEVCGDAAWYAKDFTSDGVAEAVRQLLADTESAARKAEAGIKRAALFSRAEMAKRTYLTYRKVLGRVEDDHVSEPGVVLMPGAAGLPSSKQVMHPTDRLWPGIVAHLRSVGDGAAHIAGQRGVTG